MYEVIAKLSLIVRIIRASYITNLIRFITDEYKAKKTCWLRSEFIKHTCKYINQTSNNFNQTVRLFVHRIMRTIVHTKLNSIHYGWIQSKKNSFTIKVQSNCWMYDFFIVRVFCSKVFVLDMHSNTSRIWGMSYIL